MSSYPIIVLSSFRIIDTIEGNHKARLLTRMREMTATPILRFSENVRFNLFVSATSE